MLLRPRRRNFVIFPSLSKVLLLPFLSLAIRINGKRFFTWKLSQGISFRMPFVLLLVVAEWNFFSAPLCGDSPRKKKTEEMFRLLSEIKNRIPFSKQRYIPGVRKIPQREFLSSKETQIFEWRAWATAKIAIYSEATSFVHF